MKNYYDILEVPAGCAAPEIREAYRRLAQQYLWDKEAFTELKEAYEVLTSPSKRAEYDKATFVAAQVDTPEEAEPAGDLSEFAARCPVGAAGNCPVVNARVPRTEEFCPECGVMLTTLPTAGFELTETVETPSWNVWFEEDTGRQHRLKVGPNMVGREGADVLLPDKTISRQHARIEVNENGQVSVEDLGSTNGTQINGERMAPGATRVLQNEDTVRFGSIRVVLRVPGEEGVRVRESEPEPVLEQSLDMPLMGSPLMDMSGMLGRGGEFEPIAMERVFPEPSAAQTPSIAKLVVTRGDVIWDHPLIDGLTTFGRHAESTIVLRNDPYVSTGHAQIIAEGDAFQLTDLGSTNGTLLNGERLEADAPVLLKPGDEIVIGGTIFRFEPTAGVSDGYGSAISE
ncbi:MAG: FHA domain-containing protein [Capsulimonas sp.]|uniref:FHA domain-containing protein n=1 Tax=Capsulimonas sp. TaxID=2494211 RepID=UPI003265AFE2